MNLNDTRSDDRGPQAYRLYSNDSPYSAPVRIVIYTKELDIEIVPPPGGLNSAAFHALNPTGTIPCLVRNDGYMLPESAAIMEFLEETFPSPRLLPVETELRGRVRLLQRIGELGVTRQTVELSHLVGTLKKDDPIINRRLTRLVRAIASLNVFLDGQKYAIGQEFTLADCQLGPSLFGVPAIAKQLGLGNLLMAYPRVDAYFQSIMTVASVHRVLLEMQSSGNTAK